MQRETLLMADRLGDSKSKAYALAAEIIVSTIFAPKPLNEYEVLKRSAMQAASDTADAYIQNWTLWVIGWEEMHRGRMNDARASARELLEVGRLLNDPRSTGFGLNLLSLIAMASDSYAEALEFSEQALAVAVTPWDRAATSVAKGCALTLLRRLEEADKSLQQQCSRIASEGDLYSLAGIAPMLGFSKIFHGNIAEGMRFIEELIVTRDREGYVGNANWIRLNLAQVYLEIIAGNERPPFIVLLKNLPILLKVLATASSRISALVRLKDAQWDPNGFFVGKSEMILGLLYKTKKKRALAVQHLTEAHRIISQFGQTPMLTRIDGALAELG